MTLPRYLSKNKNTRQTISTSPYLRDWIERYIKECHKKDPKDERYKSVSSFYYYVMEAILKMFSKGKSFKDIEKTADEKIESFYDKITYKAIMLTQEQALELNKYNYKSVDFLLNLFIAYKDFIFKNVDINGTLDNKTLLNVLNRFKTFMLGNKVTKDMITEIVDDKLVIEYSGWYQNIHFDNVKGLIAIASVMGLKIENVVYYKNYVKATMTKTHVYQNNIFSIKEMTTLMRSNIKYFINSYRIINDKHHHIWMKLSNDSNVMISFKDVKTGVIYIEEMVSEINEFATKDELIITILKIFENFHWIKIGRNKKSFIFLIDEEKKCEREITLKILSSRKIIEKKSDIYYVK